MSGSDPDLKNEIVVVTGPAGSGRSTAIGALEDLGFEAIDNMPISLMPRLFAVRHWVGPLSWGSIRATGTSLSTG